MRLVDHGDGVDDDDRRSLLLLGELADQSVQAGEHVRLSDTPAENCLFNPTCFCLMDSLAGLPTGGGGWDVRRHRPVHDDDDDATTTNAPSSLCYACISSRRSRPHAARWTLGVFALNPHENHEIVRGAARPGSQAAR